MIRWAFDMPDGKVYYVYATTEDGAREVARTFHGLDGAAIRVADQRDEGKYFEDLRKAPGA